MTAEATNMPAKARPSLYAIDPRTKRRNAAEKRKNRALNGLLGADGRAELVLAEERAAEIGKRIRTFGRRIRNSSRDQRNRPAKAEVNEHHAHQKQRRIIQDEQ